MPEYLAPGVYVTVIESSAKPIEGVSTSTAGLIGANVIAQLQRLAEDLRPDWTDHNQDDPGVGLVELFAFLTESLLFRSQQLPERGMPHATRLAAAALALVADRAQSHCSVLNTVRFSPGQLLGPDDLSAEVDYTRGPARGNPSLCGGIICGLEIHVTTDACGSTVNIAPGYAIDNRGHDLIVKTQISLPLPRTLTCVLVVARWKFDARWTNVLHPSLACEFFVVDEPKNDDFPLGRLDRAAEGWRVSCSLPGSTALQTK